MKLFIMQLGLSTHVKEITPDRKYVMFSESEGEYQELYRDVY
jgi:hypothetical protein